MICISLLLDGCTKADFQEFGRSIRTNVEPIGTSITDALPTQDMIALALQDTEPATAKSLSISHGGYFKILIESYCLHAGTYEPTRGEGFLIAPLTGTRAAVIQTLLRRAGKHPEVSQQDIQTVIWSLEAEEPFASLPPDLRNRVSPVVTTADSFNMSVGLKLQDVFTVPIRDEYNSLISTVSELRKQLTNVRSTYEHLANIAVLHGAPPPDPTGRDVPQGLWSAIEDGTYVRVFPHGYMLTTVELLRAPVFSVDRDQLGRIIRFTDEGVTITTTYDDRPGMDRLLLPAGQALKVWPLKSVSYADTRIGKTAKIDDAGIVIQPTQSVANLSLLPELSKMSPQINVGLLASLARLQKIQLGIPRLANLEASGTLAASGGCNAEAELDLLHYFEGLKTSLEPDASTNKWIRSTISPVVAAWAYVDAALKNTSYSKYGSCSPDRQWIGPDLTGFVAVPGNTNSQRLGISTRAAASSGSTDQDDQF